MASGEAEGCYTAPRTLDQHLRNSLSFCYYLAHRQLTAELAILRGSLGWGKAHGYYCCCLSAASDQMGSRLRSSWSAGQRIDCH